MANRDLCIMACLFCRDEQFQKWISLTYPKSTIELRVNGVLCEPMLVTDESDAKAFILKHCEIKSRNELDTDPAAAQRFHEHIRKPFLEWKDRL